MAVGILKASGKFRTKKDAFDSRAHGVQVGRCPNTSWMKGLSVSMLYF